MSHAREGRLEVRLHAEVKPGYIFFPSHYPFVAVIRGLAAVSAQRGLGAVCMCFHGRQTLSEQPLACLRARKPATNNNTKKRGRPAQKKRSRQIPAAAYGAGVR